MESRPYECSRSYVTTVCPGATARNTNRPRVVFLSADLWIRARWPARAALHAPTSAPIIPEGVGLRKPNALDWDQYLPRMNILSDCKWATGDASDGCGRAGLVAHRAVAACRRTDGVPAASPPSGAHEHAGPWRAGCPRRGGACAPLRARRLAVPALPPPLPGPPHAS